MISVIVCTRNRAELLGDCIDSLLRQQTTYDYEIIIVDNGSTDYTRKLAESFQQKQPGLKYVLEKETGLSHARNTGFRQAHYDWVAYVDDDAKAHPDFVQVACDTIKQHDFDCFGGIYNAWFRYGRPDWLPGDFGTNRYRLPDRSGKLQNRYFSGGVAVYKKELLETVGGFPADYGMKGEEMGYGEENYVQKKAREHGYVVGFNPALQIDHLVGPNKLEKSWHYEDAYKKGVTEARLHSEQLNKRILKYGFLELLKYPFRFLKEGSTFPGNRNIMYYKGYVDQFFKRSQRR